MTAWYNENDPRMADTLEELISEGHIAPGVVDRRSIIDVRAEDLRDFTQCHFFAGIGVYSHALRRVGWPDDLPCWTGSCPCQPFSLAGRGLGFDDSRHLWPHWFRLVGEHRPDVCFGEQVASAGEWLALVHTDLESLGYAFGAPDLAAAGFAGAHIRQRFFWVADANNTEWWADHAPRHLGDWSPTGRLQGPGYLEGRGYAGGLANLQGQRQRQEHADAEWRDGRDSQEGLAAGLDSSSPDGWLAHDDERGHGISPCTGEAGRHVAAIGGPDGGVGHHHPGLALGPWAADSRGAVRLQGSAAGPASPLFGCDWLLCHDAKIRPVEAGTFPLAAEAPARVGRLHGYGNAIDAETLTQFINAFIEAKYDVFF